MLKLGTFMDWSLHKCSWEVVKNAWALLEDLPKKAYDGQYIYKKKEYFVYFKTCKEGKKVFLAFQC